MRTLRIIGVLGASAILLSASAVFAEETQVGVEQKVEVRKEAMVKIEAQREETKARMEATREEAKKLVEKVREETKARMETKREEAKQRLSGIRDKAKKQLAEKLANQFDNLNSKWTDHFIQQLDRLSDILLKIQNRADIAATNGKDATVTNAVIQSANIAVASARTVVITQAAKTYTLDTSSITTTVATTTTNGQNELIKLFLRTYSLCATE